MSEYSGTDRYKTPFLMGLNLIFNLLVQLAPLFFLSEIEQDIFNAAITIPFFLRVILYTTISAIFIHYFSANPKTKYNSCINFIIFSVGSLILLCLVVVLHSDKINRLLMPGFSSDYRVLLNDSFSSLMVLPVLFLISAVLRAYLYADRRFKEVELVEFFGNATIFLIYISFFQNFSIDTAVFGIISGGMVQVLLLSALFFKNTEKITIDFNPVKWFIDYGKALVASNFYLKTEPVIDKYLLSKAPVGDLSSQAYGMILATGASAFISKILASTIIPTLTNYHLDGDHSSLMDFYKKRAIKIFIASFFLFVLSIFFIKILIHFYNVYLGENKILIKAIEYYIYLFPVLLFGSIGSLSSNSLYAVNLSKIAALNSVIIYSFFIPVKFFSFHYYGVHGLINSTNFYYFLTALVNGFCFYKITSK